MWVVSSEISGHLFVDMWGYARATPNLIYLEIAITMILDQQ